jgi:5-methylcytosine-specific restriction enzyme A
MSKIPMISSGIRTLDTRTAKPPPKRADPELLTDAHKGWAREVKRRAGWQCEWVEAGKRCEVRYPARLFADHIVERSDGGALLDPKNGRCLCGSHHTLKTVAARAARLSARP